MDWLIWQMLPRPCVSLYMRCMCMMSDAFWGGNRRSGRWYALVWRVSSQGVMRRVKAEGWSPSVSLAHSKVAITQNWLATSPLAPWLFLSLHFFSFFLLSLSSLWPSIILPFTQKHLSILSVSLYQSSSLSALSWASPISCFHIMQPFSFS